MRTVLPVTIPHRIASGAVENQPNRSLRDRVVQIVRDEFGEWRPRRSAALLVCRVLPPLVGNRLRARALRAGGVEIGKETTIGGRIELVGPERLVIGERCWINVGCHIDLAAPVTIGNDVAIAHEVLVLTNTHQVGGSDRRASWLERRPVVIEDGAWLGARVIVLPGVRVGAGSIVAAGAVVTADVPPNTIVAGVPGRVVRTLPLAPRDTEPTRSASAND